MKRFLTKKQILLAISLLLVVFATVGGTLAWLFAKTDALKNIFDPVTIDCQVNGEQESELSYSGTVTNTGTAPAYVRMAAVPSFANGTTVHYTKPDVEVTYESAEEWTLAVDGFYYYWKPLAPQETTSAVTLSTTSEAPTGYTYTVEFLGEAIQSEPPTVVQTAWPLVIYGTTVEKPTALVPVSTLGTATDGYVYLDVADTDVSNYVQLGGIDHPSINGQQYYRLNASGMADYPSDIQGIASTTAGGTLRFNTNGGSFFIKTVLRDDFTYHVDNGQPSAYCFDVYTGTGTDRVKLTTWTSSNYTESPYTSSEITLPEGTHEVMICLPHSVGFSSIQIAVSEGGLIAPPSDRLGGRIGFYGSSITQGFSATNPSLTYAMRLCRAMDADCVNFGLSGSARGEKAVIDDICAKIKNAGLTAFILDYDWNVNSPAILANGSDTQYSHYEIYQELRKALGPDVPIIMMSRPYYYGTGTLGVSEAEADNCIAVIQSSFEAARAAGDDNVAFISGKTFYLKSAAASYLHTDTIHPNNTGFEKMYDAVLPILKQLLADDSDKPGSYVQHSGTNRFTMHTYASEGVIGTAADAYQTYANMTLLEARSCSELRGSWTGEQRLKDDDDRYTFYITYNEAKWVNEIHLVGSKNNDTSRLVIYYSDGNSGWTPVDLVDDVHADSEGRLVFTFDAVKAKNFMVHAANPSAGCYYNWYEENFFGVYDPEGSANDIDIEQPAALLDRVGLNFAYTDGRTPYSYSGATTLTGFTTDDDLYGQYTYYSGDGTTNNPAAHYDTAVTFNTFTVFQHLDAYENFRYAEIWYHNGELTGADPRTYWTQAKLQGVVLTEGSATDALCRYVYPSANNMTQGYTYILSAPVTAKYIMVNFVYDGLGSNEGHVYQMLSFAGFDRDYAGYDLPMTQLGTGVTLDLAYTDNRTGQCFYGVGSLDTLINKDSYGGEAWFQATNQDPYTYNSAVAYSAPVTFNTFTTFATKANPYENFLYAEIWYYNEDLTDADPRTYWTKAALQGAVYHDAATAASLLTKVYTGNLDLSAAYTWVLDVPITAKHIMVNFVYSDARSGNEGEVYQYLSFAGYDANYAG